MNLTNLKTGERGIITSIDENCPMKARLRELGFCKGSHITPIHESISSNLRAYLIKGVVIALRTEDTDKIYIQPREV